MTVKTYDSKCFDLAEHFIEDLKTPSAAWRVEKTRELALEIQQTIEDWMSENDPDDRQGEA